MEETHILTQGNSHCSYRDKIALQQFCTQNWQTFQDLDSGRCIYRNTKLMNHSMLRASCFLTCFWKLREQTDVTASPSTWINDSWFHGPHAITMPVLLAEPQGLASFILLLYCTLLRRPQTKMRRTYREKDEEKISILNRKGRSNTEKRWNSDRCLYFLHLCFKWIFQYWWSCRTAALRQLLAQMQYNLWYNPVGKTAWNSVPLIMRKWSKKFPFAGFIFYPHNQFCVPRTFVSALSWDPSHDCFSHFLLFS